MIPFALGSYHANLQSGLYARLLDCPEAVDDNILITMLMVPDISPNVDPNEMRVNALSHHPRIAAVLNRAADILDEIAERNSYNIVAGETRGGVRPR